MASTHNEDNKGKRFYQFDIAAHDLHKMDLTGKSDPYIVIETPLDTKPKHKTLQTFIDNSSDISGDIGNLDFSNDVLALAILVPVVAAAAVTAARSTHHTTKGYKQVYESSVIKKTLDCSWPTFSIWETDLCDGYIDQEILIKCYDWDRIGASRLIGQVKTTAREMVDLKSKDGQTYVLRKEGKPPRGLLQIKCIPNLRFSNRELSFYGPSPSKSGFWEGFYVYTNTGEKDLTSMNVTMTEGDVAGVGTDLVGKFLIKGEYHETTKEIKWDKKYIGSHTIHYEGHLIQNDTKIEGEWFSGGFPKGHFELQHTQS